MRKNLFLLLFLTHLLVSCSGGTGSSVDYSLSSFTIQPNTGLAADGSTTATITATVRNAQGQPIRGKTVTIEASGSNNTITQPSSTSNADGMTSGSISSTKAELKDITVRVHEGDEPSPLAINQNARVSFGSMFGPRKDFSIGSTPRGLSVGDFNGDGLSDYAAAINGSTAVVVLLALNLGSGDLTLAPLSFTVGTSPTATAIADFDDDTLLDLAVANGGADTISILEGKGNGSFDPPTDSNGTPQPFPTVTTGDNPQALLAADLDGDDHPDLVSVNQTPATVSVLLGVGDGTFGTKTDFAVGTTPVAIAAGDLNSGTGPDLVVANSGVNSISLLLNNGSGSFTAGTSLTTIAPPNSIAMGDINSDGKLDVVTSNTTGTAAQRISVFLGDGDGTFGSESLFDITGTATALALVDINGNGLLDIVTTSGSNITARLGDGLGTFSAQLTGFATPSSSGFLITGESSDDGILEVLTANTTSGNVSLFTAP